MNKKTLQKYVIGGIAASMLMCSSAVAASDQTQKVTSETEGVTYGMEQQYSQPADTSRFANIRTATGCVAILILIGAIPCIVTYVSKKGQKRQNAESAYLNNTHKEAVHRIVDTNQQYRAYIERDTIKGYNLVVVGANGHWSGNFPDEEAARCFAYENGIAVD